MPIAFWRDDYNTGYEEIDRQHQHLFWIINNLHDAVLAGNGVSLIESTLDNLFDYTLEHFQAEEALMTAYHYPNQEAHVKKHDNLREQVIAMRQKLGDNLPLLSIELSKFLADWLIHHIKDDDQAMIRFLHQTCDAKNSRVSEPFHSLT